MGVLEGKSIVVTGAGRGLGAAYARLAATFGARLVVNDVDADAAVAVTDEILRAGGEAVANHCDVSLWDGAAQLIAQCVAQYGAVDGLVNNAARFYLSRPDEEDEATLRALIEVNVLGTAFCGIHALRHMMARGSGSVVNITSGAQAGSSLQAIYGASKGAVASLTYGWSVDAESSGVRVNAVSPMARTAMAGIADTYFTQRQREPWPHISATADDNAPVVVYLLSDDAVGVNGQVVRIDGDRLSLMTHPAVLHPPIANSQWTVDAVAAAFRETLRGRQMPLGVIGAEVVLHPYALHYRRDSDRA